MVNRIFPEVGQMAKNTTTLEQKHVHSTWLLGRQCQCSSANSLVDSISVCSPVHVPAGMMRTYNLIRNVNLL